MALVFPSPLYTPLASGTLLHPLWIPRLLRVISTPRFFINGHELVDRESADDVDIYRGDSCSTPQSQESGSATSTKSLSDTSASTSRLPGGRLGALATRLDRAITRWARRNRADSSSIASSGTSNSFRSSFRTTNKSSRRRRPPSIADIQHREESERAVAARIRAREIGRVVPREFNLYVPLSHSQDTGPIEEKQQVVRTFSLDVMLPHLNPLLRNSGIHRRRPRHRSHVPRTELDYNHHYSHLLHPHLVHSAEDDSNNTSHSDVLRSLSPTVEKGKDKISSSPDPLQIVSTSRGDLVVGKPRQAWWLDVASPTWEDIKTLGRLLHLHPLTLEDILQREPREKLESFSKLGYYFIILRAIDYSTWNERLEIVSQKTGSSQVPVQGVTNETCIYLVVFRDGICTFHFSNVSEHLDRVRGKLQTTAQTTRRSSAWIAHEILDSVVDSFFPLVEEIEEHIVAIESVVHDEDNPASTITPIPPANTRSLRILPAGEKVVTATSFVDENSRFPSRPVDSCYGAGGVPFLALSTFVNFCMPRKPYPSFTRASFNLHRMARTRHLATSLGRVLATKPEVVARIRKRLLASASDDAEVDIYFGDVHDHILTLQQSLAHYERMLSESHPMYLRNLHLDLLRVRAKVEYGTFLLTLVAVMVVPPLVVIDTYALSMNVRLPRNNDGEYWIFGVVITTVLCIQASLLCLVRYWWVNAKRVKLE